MGRSKNTLKISEVTSIPLVTAYSASYVSSSFINYGITVNKGVNSPYIVSGSLSLNYKLAKQLYYNEFITGSLNRSASYWDDTLQSTAASGTFDVDYRYYPTSSNSVISIIAIPRMVFGENISRKSFSITSSTYNLVDDGNGNVKDAKNSNAHVGNILYSQGIVIITNQDYSGIFI